MTFGSESPVTVKLAVALACEIVTGDVPAVTVNVCDVLVPTLTVPKLNEPGLTVSAPAEVLLPDTVMLRGVLYTAPVLSQAWTTT